ncbi:hypothetical protein BGZ75_000757, partial [Mortierella antarctica]
VDVENATVLESVRRVQTDLATLLEHEHASLALAQRCSSIPSGSPLFSAILNYRHNVVLPEQAELNTGIELLDGQERSSYPFVMSVEDFGDSLGVTAQIVEPHDSLAICGYMQQTLLSIANALEQSPNSPVHALSILSPEESDLMVRVWNNTDADFPADRRIHQLFEDHAALYPQATALVHDDQSLTYHELNVRANVLAHRLIESGVKHGDYVAVLLHRSFDLVAAQLAILKVGAAYVPIDPKAPVDRQAFIVKDSASSLLITDVHMNVPSAMEVQLLRLDSGNSLFKERENITLAGSSQDTAYAMYTSGSTGVPKGVMVPHRAISRLVINCGYANIGPNDRVAFAANPAFDASTFELWAPLRNGGCAVIIDADTFTDSHLLAKALERHRINTLWLTMALFNQYVLSIGPSLAKLKYLLCGGEQGNLETFAALLKHGGPENLINGYGPTETTTFAATFNASRMGNQFDRLPIGRPIGNTQVYVLDKHCNLVPLGATGELFIGGAGVATGYLNQPDLTAERFLPDPFSNVEDARMYKTGDLVRYLPDGNLVFMGRNDEQVKIRGFRIELGEIEARLVEHELVKEAVVLALGEGGDKRLVAYVAAEPNEQIALILREHLATNMPEYMVPAAFVRLDILPVTNNGKVNRRALPKPDSSAFAAQGYEEPRGEVETALALIWAQLLKMERVGRNDNFFMLGGHSLLAVQMIEQLRRIGLSLSVRALFDTPVLSVLAASLNTHQAAPETPANLITAATTDITPELLPLIDLTQGDIDRIVDQVPGGVANIQDIYSLSPLQDGILFHHMMATEGDPYLLIAGFTFRDKDLLDRYLSAVQQIVDRHDILRTAIVSKNMAIPAQVVLRKAAVSVTELTLDPADGTLSDQLMQRYDTRKYRIELHDAPLVRFVYSQDVDGRYVMVQLLHHIIGDHSTMEIMEEEIEKILGGQEDTLAEPQPFRNLIAQ